MTIKLHDFDGEHSLTMDVGDLAADAAVVDAEHEPNGYFWEGLVRFAWPDIAGRLDFDSEAGMFCAVGSPSDLALLKTAAESVVRAPRQSATSSPGRRLRASSSTIRDPTG